jgi:hypothetical protein
VTEPLDPNSQDPAVPESPDPWLEALAGRRGARGGKTDQLAAKLRMAVKRQDEIDRAQIPPARMVYLKRRLLDAVPASAKGRTLSRAPVGWLAAAAAVGAVAILVGQRFPGGRPVSSSEELVLLESGELSTSRGASSEQPLWNDDPSRLSSQLVGRFLAAGVPVRLTYRQGDKTWLLEAEASAMTNEQAAGIVQSVGLKLPADGQVRIRIHALR